jgi:hypothetical protein
MKSRPKRRQVGTAGLVLRYRKGTIAHACRRCGQWDSFTRWRPAMRQARAHAAQHHATQTRYAATPVGINAIGRRRTRKPRRRLAAVAAVLLLAVLALGVTVTSLTSRAGQAPAPTTTYAPYQYIPTPAGPPPSSTAGGDR